MITNSDLLRNGDLLFLTFIANLVKPIQLICKETVNIFKQNGQILNLLCSFKRSV